MAVVDSLLRLIPAQGADALIIPPGDAPSLEKNGEPQQLSMPYPGDELVEEMLREVTSNEERTQLQEHKLVETRYTADDGTEYVVRIEARATGRRLTFRVPQSAAAIAAAEAAAPAPEALAATPAVGTVAHRPPPVLTPPPDRSAPDAAQAGAASDDAPPVVAAPIAVTVETTLDHGEASVCEPGTLREVFEVALARAASDLLLSVGKPPHLRVGGQIMQVPGSPVTTPELMSFLEPTLTRRARHDLEVTGSADVAVLVDHSGSLHRFRANVFRQHTGLAAALRPIRRQAPTLRELSLPEEMLGLIRHHSGLVLMTGTTGSGKSTTLVSLIEHINRTAPKHVITLEDPIEYEYVQQQALIHQRQVGTHVDRFDTGLRAALRETPDVILLGEMRDHATIAAALTAAETGHLVLSTLHASGAAMAVDRMIDVFPEHQQQQVRLQLAAVLRAIVTQRLLPTTRPPTRVPALELLQINTAVASKIREGRGHQLQSEIQKGRAEGMIPLEVTLAGLVRRGLISVETAMDHAAEPTLMQQYLR